jgi:hypothetical protein
VNQLERPVGVVLQQGVPDIEREGAQPCSGHAQSVTPAAVRGQPAAAQMAASRPSSMRIRPNWPSVGSAQQNQGSLSRGAARCSGSVLHSDR